MGQRHSVLSKVQNTRLSNGPKKDCFKLSDDFPDVTLDTNHGNLPLVVFHEIFSFLRPGSLINVFCSCRLFYKVCHTQLFWKEYFKNTHSSFSFLIQPTTKNWKQAFFMKCGSDWIYERIYRRIDHKKPKNIKEKCVPLDLLLLGGFGIGKTSFKFQVTDQTFGPQTEEDIRFRHESRELLVKLPSNLNIGIFFRDCGGICSSSSKSPRVARRLKRIYEHSSAGSFCQGNRACTSCLSGSLAINSVNSNFFLADGIFLAFDMSDRSSFLEMKEVFWPRAMYSCKKKCSFVLVGLKSDQRHEKVDDEVEEKTYEFLEEKTEILKHQRLEAKKERSRIQGQSDDEKGNKGKRKLCWRHRRQRNQNNRALRKEEILEFVVENSIDGYCECSSKLNKNVRTALGVMLTAILKRKMIRK